MKDPVIISHLYNDSENGWQIQTNEQHSAGVARLAERFAAEFGMGSWGRLLGLLHDRGKESDGFQAYIRRNSGYEAEVRSTEAKAHSYIGAIIAHRHPFDQRLCWLSNAIASHHGGLHNLDELELTFSKEIPDEVSDRLPEVPLTMPFSRLPPTASAYIARMLFSCLVDADWLDTEAFMSPKTSTQRGCFSTFEELNKKLEDFRANLSALPQTPLNLLRNEIQEKCQQAAVLETGFFDLTVPTGGGKTIASVIWALKHTLHHGKKRIIIAIPFTSIIVQTAATLRKIFGDNNVVEHHSVVNEDAADDSTLLACENWDAPIIVTTNVQFFESIFSNRRSACRKLHSIANSVVILDEVQALPISFLQPIVDALKSYNKLFGTSFLFCTASQPILYGEHKGTNQAVFNGLNPHDIRPIIPPTLQLHDKLRRVDISVAGIIHDYTSLADSLRQHQRVLCVVNTRNHAHKLYQELHEGSDIPTYHLSRCMCGEHILSTIEKIKKLLENPKQPIRVVSTQLIEAGVDIDFPVVFRQLAGLDSILQAAGRCNREGKLAKGSTIVFDFEKDKKYGLLATASDTMIDLVSIKPDADWQSPDIMETYFTKLYRRIPYFDKEDIITLQSKLFSCQFEEISKKFHLINENGRNIIVNFGDAERLIEKIRQKGITRKLSRELGRFSVTVPERAFRDFYKAGLLEEILPGVFYCHLATQYDPMTGLKSENEFLEQTFII